ncbi:ly6/PLAUR domain-containing protein 8 [Kogia breviceps]|uniref:ly6/PLAUR domain-containing protein 8 n=1 Tax=Kogia breviceps TaxID=27615 RepID=UPI002795FA16|nr:ly6/PLAUR domain-containing protein 8 [Kogia breviceps]
MNTDVCVFIVSGSFSISSSMAVSPVIIITGHTSNHSQLWFSTVYKALCQPCTVSSLCPSLLQSVCFSLHSAAGCCCLARWGALDQQARLVSNLWDMRSKVCIQTQTFLGSAAPVFVLKSHMSNTMKGFLFAGIIVMLTVAAVESLSCVQCNSLTDSCVDRNATECPTNASISCTTFLVNFSLGENITLYEYKACSVYNCSEDMVETFTVHISANESFHFASQCCQGKACNDINDTKDPPQEEVSSNTDCLACYGSNETSCNETIWKCYKEERCVHLIVEFKNEMKLVLLKGCSNANNSTCEFLVTENWTVGGVTFLKFECGDSSDASSTPTPATLSTTPDTGSKVFFTPLTLASLLLLGFLL